MVFTFRLSPDLKSTTYVAQPVQTQVFLTEREKLITEHKKNDNTSPQASQCTSSNIRVSKENDIIGSEK